MTSKVKTAVLDRVQAKFRGTGGFVAKDLTFEAKDLKNCPRCQGHPRGIYLCFYAYFLQPIK